MQSESTPKLCECGCGEPAPIATQTKAKWGHVQGQPMRFVRGHAMTGRRMAPESVERVAARFRGVPLTPEHRRKIGDAQLGEKGPNWGGGRIFREGRTLIYVGREHPMADTYGYVYEHRLVVANVMGRPLTHAEHVHHRDLNPTNNTLANLLIVNNRDHKRIHNEIQWGASPEEAIRKVLG